MTVTLVLMAKIEILYLQEPVMGNLKFLPNAYGLLNVIMGVSLNINPYIYSL